MSARPLLVAIGRDCELVTAGLSASLLPHADRVEVLLLDGAVPPGIDVLLQDPQVQMGDLRLADLAGLVVDGHPRLVGYGWSTYPGYVHRVLGQGAVGYLSKALSTGRLVASLETIAAGGRLALDADGNDILEPEPSLRESTLSAREVEILALIAEGRTNAQIHAQLYLSINTVKTYIRNAYRKIGVSSRAQAVAWYVHHRQAGGELESVAHRPTAPAPVG